MRNWLLSILVLLAGSLMGQPAGLEMPIGIFRGTLVDWQGTTAAGDLTVRRADSAVFVCHYDSHSLVELENRPVRISKLTAGDPLEVLADRMLGSRTCYARIVEVVNPAPKRPKAQPASFQAFTPRGDRTVAGVVLRRDASALTIRTRTGDVILLLRSDTRYLGDGVSIGADALTVNAHVSVRAGKDLYGNIEAYQVMWGEILDVR